MEVTIRILMPLTEFTAYPWKIKSTGEARTLYWIGDKMERKVMHTVALAQRRRLTVPIDWGIPQIRSNQ